MSHYSPSRRRRGEEGYNLVILIVAITILNIMVAVAMPMVSYTIRRDREEETIFRGLQYAEAIRVFRQRFGRYPASLQELVEVEPRSIRQLWKEPLSEAGEFGLVIEAPPAAPNASGGAQAGQPGAPPTSPQQVTLPAGPAGSNAFGGFGVGGTGRVNVNLVKLPRARNGEKTLTSEAIAIHGVYLDRQGESLRKFFGHDKYEQWVFAAELILPPITAPGRPLPRVGDDWLGRSFPDGLSPSIAGGGPGGAPPQGSGNPGAELGGGQAPAADPQRPVELGATPLDEAPEQQPEEPPEDVPETFPEDFPEDVPQDTPVEDPAPPEETFPDPLDDADGGAADALAARGGSQDRPGLLADDSGRFDPADRIDRLGSGTRR